MQKKRVMISAGDISGDIYAAELVDGLRKKYENIEFLAVAGERTASRGVELLAHSNDLNIMGFTQVVANIGLIFSTWRKLTNALQQWKPDVLVLIDYPGLNMRLAKVAARCGIEVLYYVPPQVWAWGRSRVRHLRRDVAQLLVLYPHEYHYLHSQRLPVKMVSHPLLQQTQWLELPTLASNDPLVIVLMPGSRRQELERHVDVMLSACYQLQVSSGQPVCAVLLKAPGIAGVMCEQACTAWKSVLQVHTVAVAQRQQWLTRAHCACVVSGTASFELALMGLPMLVVYTTNWVNYTLARLLLATRLRWISLPNLSAQADIVPELVRVSLDARLLAEHLHRLVYDADYRSKMRCGLAALRQKVQVQQTDMSVAEHVGKLMHSVCPNV